MEAAYFITAIGTPLDDDENLCVEGLEKQFEDQADAGIPGILSAGSMGCMQLLRDSTYQALAEHSVRCWKGKGELLFGVGDTSFARTKDRIEFANRFDFDGVVVLTPFHSKFSQEDLVDYYKGLADVAKSPLYLYDLPAVVGMGIDMETYFKVAEHPNIRGGKISGRREFSCELIRRIDPEKFRVIVAEPYHIDQLLNEGVSQQLEGMFAIAPQWTVAIGKGVAENDQESAALYQKGIYELRELLVSHKKPMGVFTALMNARGIPGKFHPAPLKALDEEELRQLLSEKIVRQLLGEIPLD